MGQLHDGRQKRFKAKRLIFVVCESSSNASNAGENSNQLNRMAKKVIFKLVVCLALLPGSGAKVAPLPCENHGRELRTFFTVVREPNIHTFSVLSETLPDFLKSKLC